MGVLRFDISAWVLRCFAMGFMVLDHLWATVVPGQEWMAWAGRLAYPIFAFLLTEGYRHTGNFKKYLSRMALFALISEVPFDLMGYGTAFFPFHQNVLWTFCLGLLAMNALDKLKAKQKPWLAIPLGAGLMLLLYLAGLLTMADYGGWGVMTVLVFFLFPGNTWWEKAAQVVLLYLINWEFMGSQTLPVEIFGLAMELPRQGMAVFALPLIWLYKGRQGPKTHITKWIGYWFYPVHALILGLLNG